MQNNRKKSLIGAFVLLLVLISGTFAFYQFNQGAFNPVRIEQVTLGRLHDDFEARTGPGLLDKDIYAENFTTADIMVRVQFREFLELNGEIFGDDVVINDHRTWPTVMFDGISYVPGSATDSSVPGMVVASRAAGISTEIGEQNISWNLGNPEEYQKIFMPTHNQVHRTGVLVNSELESEDFDETPFTMNDAVNMARFANTTGHAGEALAGGVFGSSAPGNTGLGADTIEEFFNGVQTGASVHDGTSNFWNNAFTTAAPTVAGNYHYDAYLFYIDATYNHITRSEDLVRHYAQPTLTVTPDTTIEGLYNGIITINDWLDAGAPEGNFWIMDSDGWFYWNGYLLGSDERARLYNEDETPLDERLPSTATSLLLNGISVPAHNDLSYIIHVDANWFTTEDMAQLYPLPTLDILDGFGVEPPSVPTDPTDPTDPIDPEESSSEITVARITPSEFATANGMITPGVEHTIIVSETVDGEIDEDAEFEVVFLNEAGQVIGNAGAQSIIGFNELAIAGTPFTFTPVMNFQVLSTEEPLITIQVTSLSTGDVVTETFGINR